MKLKFFCIFFLMLFFCINSFAQKKPFWLEQVETAMQQNAFNPKISLQTFPTGADYFKYILYLTLSDGQLATVTIEKEKPKTETKKDLKSRAEIFSNYKVAKNVPYAELKNIGDEAYIWKFSKGETFIMMKKGSVFINIVTNRTSLKEISEISLEDWAKNLAQTIDVYLPSINS
jgi:hypothetical protein